MTHTPGPWHRNIKPTRKYGTIFAGRNTHVAYLAVNGLSDDEIEDNCNLVTAAPDLLAALQDAEFLLRQISINWKEAAAMKDSAKRSADDARAAIAKATE